MWTMIALGNPAPPPTTPPWPIMRTWQWAKWWASEVNAANVGKGMPVWSWDCSFKLDFDGRFTGRHGRKLFCSARFYPEGHGLWSGEVEIFAVHPSERDRTGDDLMPRTLDGAPIALFDVQELPLEDLRKTVEAHVQSFMVKP